VAFEWPAAELVPAKPVLPATPFLYSKALPPQAAAPTSAIGSKPRIVRKDFLALLTFSG
jgi:hypothetical protein